MFVLTCPAVHRIIVYEIFDGNLSIDVPCRALIAFENVEVNVLRASDVGEMRGIPC